MSRTAGSTETDGRADREERRGGTRGRAGRARRDGTHEERTQRPRPRRTRWILTAQPLLLLPLLLGACSDDPARPSGTVEVGYDFTGGDAGFVTGFADYPEGEEEFYELDAGLEPLPEGLERTGTGLMLTGNNHSDDLFMFAKKRVDGLVAGRAYDVTLEVTFATDVPSGCSGVGGSPGESVYVKAGVSAEEPATEEDEEGWLRMTVDKGNQEADGEDGVTIGTVANSVPDCGEAEWELKSLSTEPGELSVTADAQGRAWLLVGFDSGFEATSLLYLVEIEAVFEPR